MIFFETHQLSYGARIFSLVSRFSSTVPTRLGGFSLTPEAGFSSLPSSYRKEVFFNRLPLILTLSSEVVFPPQFPPLLRHYTNDYTFDGAHV